MNNSDYLDELVCVGIASLINKPESRSKTGRKKINTNAFVRGMIRNIKKSNKLDELQEKAANTLLNTKQTAEVFINFMDQYKKLNGAPLV